MSPAFWDRLRRSLAAADASGSRPAASPGGSDGVAGDVGGSEATPHLLWPAAAVLAVLGWVLIFLAFRPGFMTWDSFNMWNMGAAWRFHDHHNPVIGVMLGVSRLVTGDPSAYLALQLGLWWGGAYLFAVAWRVRVGRWALLAVLVGFTPPALSLMGYIHKTPLLTACFLFGTSWLFLVDVRRRRPGVATILVVLPVLFIGAVARGYSYPSAVPILAYGAWLGCRGRWRAASCVRRSAAFALVVTAAFVVADQGLTYRVLHARRSFKIQTVYRFDLAAIHVLTGRTYAAKYLLDRYRDPETAAAFYRQYHGLWRIMDMYQRVDNPAALRELRREWLRAIVENPRAYLAHRGNAIARSFGWRVRVWGYRRFDTDSPENTAGLTQPDSALRGIIQDQQMRVRDLFFMKPWFWSAANVALSLAAAILLLRGGDRLRHAVLPHAAMLWSGLLLLLPWLLVCLDVDARFTYWVRVSTIFGGLGLAGLLLGALRTRLGAGGVEP